MHERTREMNEDLRVRPNQNTKKQNKNMFSRKKKHTTIVEIF